MSGDSGALVLSLDFELHWGIRDHTPPEAPYRKALLNARDVVVELLQRFASREIACTWATVGFLFASNREELQASWPMVKPVYSDAGLQPYVEPVGVDEADDPIHYAASLIRMIGDTARQEIGTHTYSHYYCGEEGADLRSFLSDLKAAQGASEVPLRSIVFPRNQSREEFLTVLSEAGVDVFRGNPPGNHWQANSGAASRQWFRRFARLVDSYVPIRDSTVLWSEVVRPDGLADVRASQFLRPLSSPHSAIRGFHLRRIEHGMRSAAKSRGIFHLWWHPHNFGLYPEQSLNDLDRLLDRYEQLRDQYGMRSLTMAEAADIARAR